MSAGAAAATDPAGRPAAERTATDGDGRVRSYYGRPIVKEPEWTWEVPWYLFAGGLGGAAATLGAGAGLVGKAKLARNARRAAAASAVVSTPLLIADLGRPSRFLNMLRVFKPTSVMSVGSWTLAAFSGAVTAGTALDLMGRLPLLRTPLDAAGGLLGLGMTTYTGALVADTSIPVWHEARRHLPGLFAGSGLASAGAALNLVTSPERAGPARRAAVVGGLAELAVDRHMRAHLGPIGAVYERERAGAFHKAAEVATAAGTAMVALGGSRRRWLTAAGSVALLAGSICQRWSVYHAGFQSARDPAAVVVPQRRRLERGEGYRTNGHASRD
jgi:hypothetical protein